MTKLQAGDKVFAYIVGRGYVGYGTVSEAAVMARDFKTANGILLDQPLKGLKALSEFRDDEANAEYVVAVDWRKAVDRDHAQTYPGIFANQNIVCRIRDVRTIEFLAERFDVAPQPEPNA